MVLPLITGTEGVGLGVAVTAGTGFGSRLINSLVKQLKGEINVNKTPEGWTYNLTLPITK